MLKKILKYALLIFILAGLGIGIYGWYLSYQVEKRFSARRWQIPSTVYSDTTLLYPGQRFNPDIFSQKLSNLGYRRVDHLPSQKGELQITPLEMNIFLNDLKTPWRTRDGFPVRVISGDNAIETIHRLDNGDNIPILELEPEEMMQFFGPERERRHLISIEQVPEHLILAVLAAPSAQTAAIRSREAAASAEVM